MEKIIYLFIHLALPLVIIIDFVLRRHKSTIGLITKMTLYVSIIYFLFIWGQWAIAGSYYLRYFMLLIILIILVIGSVRYHSNNKAKYISTFKKIVIGLTGLLSLLIFTIALKASIGNSYTNEAIELKFPLKGGEYYISSGGANKLINNHMRDYPNAQQYALDINKLGGFMGVSKRIMSTNNADHYIFSDTIYCPCNAIVLETKNTIRDNSGSRMHVKPEDGTGNYVKLKCDSVYIFIPHIKQFSILVSKGMKVEEGSPLGLVGISGFSQEPHLHIQASIYNSDSIMTGIPIKFNGKILSRNDLYANY